jgi:hypothetical protein
MQIYRATLNYDAGPDLRSCSYHCQYPFFLIFLVRVIPWMLIRIRANDADPTRSGSTTLHKTRLLIVDKFLVYIIGVFKHVQTFLMKHRSYPVVQT